jgi:TRAP-type transport system small permease protein
MKFYSAICATLAHIVLHLARIALASLGLVVLYGVVMRYAFNNAPPYVEQVALILVISVAMLGAAAGAREGGHIGLDSIIKRLPDLGRKLFGTAVDLLTLLFAAVILYGSAEMGTSTLHDTIPTLGISEAWRYLPVVVASALIFLFAIEHSLVLWAGLKLDHDTHLHQASDHDDAQPSSTSI